MPQAATAASASSGVGSTCDAAPVDTAARYRRFARVEAGRSSPSYERLARGVADDQDLCALLDGLPDAKRQPNLLFAAVRFLGGPTGGWPEFRSFVVERWGGVSTTMLERSTQTNEVGRCAVLLPVLAALDGPLALIEIGASAGLCLYPDRYRYRYDGRVVGGPSPVVLDIGCSGPVPVPRRPPEVAWRAGLDLAPLDVGDPDDVAWLRACIWPEHEERRRRLDAAVRLVAADRPRLDTADLLIGTDALIDDAPAGATTVVFHSAVLAYLAPDDRRRFAAGLRGRDVVWVSNEAPGVVAGPDPGAGAEPPPDAGAAARFVVRVGPDARPVAVADPHGGWLRWL